MNGILLLFLSWGLTAAAQAPVLSPRIGVAIADADVLRSRKLKPALMATDGQNLYVSSQSEIEGCVGQGLYRIALGGKNPLAIEEIPLQRGGQPLPHPVCVQRLQVHGKLVLVHHTWQSTTQIDRLQNTELASFLAEGPDPKVRGLWRWKLHEIKTRVPDFDKIVWMAVSIDSQAVRLAGYLPGEKSLRHIAVSLVAGDRSELLELRALAELAPETFSQLDFMGPETLVATYQPKDFRSFGNITFLSLKDGHTEKFGGSHAYIQDSVWNDLPAQDWSARRLTAVSVQSTGLYLADATTLANEYPLLAFFDVSMQSVFRVQGLHDAWSKQLKAVTPWQNGLLLAYKEPPLIAFVGDKNPFPENVAPSRMPDLQEITESDYLKLLEEQTNDKRD